LVRRSYELHRVQIVLAILTVVAGVDLRTTVVVVATVVTTTNGVRNRTRARIDVRGGRGPRRGSPEHADGSAHERYHQRQHCGQRIEVSHLSLSTKTTNPNWDRLACQDQSLPLDSMRRALAIGAPSIRIQLLAQVNNR